MASNSYYDEHYEFNAPQTYIDFTNFNDDEEENSFFGKFVAIICANFIIHAI